MKSKLLTVRIPADFHKALMDHCEQRFLPASSLVLQLIAKEIGYRHRKAAPRSYTPEVSPPVATEPDFNDLLPEDYSVPEYGDIDFEELQRRAATAPLRPAG